MCAVVVVIVAAAAVEFLQIKLWTGKRPTQLNRREIHKRCTIASESSLVQSKITFSDVILDIKWNSKVDLVGTEKKATKTRLLLQALAANGPLHFKHLFLQQFDILCVICRWFSLSHSLFLPLSRIRRINHFVRNDSEIFVNSCRRDFLFQLSEAHNIWFKMRERRQLKTTFDNVHLVHRFVYIPLYLNISTCLFYLRRVRLNIIRKADADCSLLYCVSL